jgi:hypothetical protein
MARLLAVLLAALLSAVALAGCADDADDAGTPTPSPEPTTPTPTTPGDGGDGGDDNETPPPPARADVVVTDAGDVQGPFEKSWTLDVPDAAYRSVLVQFNLTPAQDGAPVTARVYVTFTGPDGAVLQSATVGLGGAPAAEFSFSPGALPAGSYTLAATAEPSSAPAPGLPGTPSFGVAKFDVYAIADY